MKKSTFLWTLVSIILIGVLIITTGFKPEDINKKYLSMRVIELSVGSKSKIVIINENNEKEEIVLKSIKKEPLINLETINQTINSISAKGYTLVSSSSGGDNYVIFSNYVFEKNE